MAGINGETLENSTSAAPSALIVCFWNINSWIKSPSWIILEYIQTDLLTTRGLKALLTFFPPTALWHDFTWLLKASHTLSTLFYFKIYFTKIIFMHQWRLKSFSNVFFSYPSNNLLLSPTAWCGHKCTVRFLQREWERKWHLSGSGIKLSGSQKWPWWRWVALWPSLPFFDGSDHKWAKHI